MTESATLAPVTEHRARWKWFLALGASLLVLGAAGIGIGVATLLELTSILVFGPLLLASSLFQFLTALFAEKGTERRLHFAAAVEAVLGFAIMVHPLHRVVSLIALVAILLMVGGLARLARSLAARSRGRAWTVLTGGIAVLLGISVWIGWPVAGWWFVGLCIAVDFIGHGVSWSALALAERQPLQRPDSWGARSAQQSAG
jgi:uncharacterized membrane protein HdeD (DUF308 family)